MWNFLRFRRTPVGVQALVRTPLTRTEAATKPGFVHVRVWTCTGHGCNAAPPGTPARPAQLTLRRREDLPDWPSNFGGVHTAESVRKARLHARQIGHSIVPSETLNWNGLAEERGWTTAPVRCPACQAGVSVAEFRAARRAAALRGPA